MHLWKYLGLSFLLAMALHVDGARAEGAANRIGGGANYWVVLDDIDTDDIDDKGFSYLVSFQHKRSLLGFGIDVELLPDRLGEDAVAPQVYLILGKAIYAAAGIGTIYTDGEFADDPFYSVRAGFDLEIVDNLFLDIYGNYRFESDEQFEGSDTNIDTDTVFLGAAIRFGL